MSELVEWLATYLVRLENKKKKKERKQPALRQTTSLPMPIVYPPGEIGQ